MCEHSELVSFLIKVDKNCFKRFPFYDVFVSYILGLFLTV